MKKQGYTQAQTKHTMFIRHSREGRVIGLIVYEEDIKREMDRLKASLAIEFEI